MSELLWLCCQVEGVEGFPGVEDEARVFLELRIDGGSVSSSVAPFEEDASVVPTQSQPLRALWRETITLPLLADLQGGRHTQRHAPNEVAFGVIVWRWHLRRPDELIGLTRVPLPARAREVPCVLGRGRILRVPIFGHRPHSGDLMPADGGDELATRRQIGYLHMSIRTLEEQVLRTHRLLDDTSYGLRAAEVSNVPSAVYVPRAHDVSIDSNPDAPLNPLRRPLAAASAAHRPAEEDAAWAEPAPPPGEDDEEEKEADVTPVKREAEGCERPFHVASQTPISIPYSTPLRSPDSAVEFVGGGHRTELAPPTPLVPSPGERSSSSRKRSRPSQAATSLPEPSANPEYAPVASNGHGHGDGDAADTPPRRLSAVPAVTGLYSPAPPAGARPPAAEKPLAAVQELESPVKPRRMKFMGATDTAAAAAAPMRDLASPYVVGEEGGASLPQSQPRPETDAPASGLGEGLQPAPNAEPDAGMGLPGDVAPPERWDKPVRRRSRKPKSPSDYAAQAPRSPVATVQKIVGGKPQPKQVVVVDRMFKRVSPGTFAAGGAGGVAAGGALARMTVDDVNADVVEVAMGMNGKGQKESPSTRGGKRRPAPELIFKADPSSPIVAGPSPLESPGESGRGDGEAALLSFRPAKGDAMDLSSLLTVIDAPSPAPPENPTAPAPPKARLAARMKQTDVPDTHHVPVDTASASATSSSEPRPSPHSEKSISFAGENADASRESRRSNGSVNRVAALAREDRFLNSPEALSSPDQPTATTRASMETLATLCALREIAGPSSMPTA